MKKWKLIVAMFCVTATIVMLCACGGKTTPTTPTEPETTTMEVKTPEEDVFDVNVESLNWADGELDCYDYDYMGQPYYMSFKYPDSFQTSGYDDSGEQSRSYWAAPDDGSASESKYGIYAYFLQGGYGPRRNTLSESIVGGQLEERQFGDVTVLFGLMDDTENPEASGYTYCYYLTYEDDDFSRIWVLVQDQEKDGLFRKTFEESLNFQK